MIWYRAHFLDFMSKVIGFCSNWWMCLFNNKTNENCMKYLQKFVYIFFSSLRKVFHKPFREDHRNLRSSLFICKKEVGRVCLHSTRWLLDSLFKVLMINLTFKFYEQLNCYLKIKVEMSTYKCQPLP